MSYTLPSDSHAVSDTGHTSDHNNTIDVLTGMGAVYNVQNTAYSGGASPGGSASANATAIQAAITACGNAGGGVVRIPAGTYNYNAALSILKNNVILAGDGPATVLNQTSTTANGITLSSSGASADLIGVQIRDLAITGPGSGSGVGISGAANSGSYNLRALVLRNLEVTGFGSNGVSLTSPITSVVENVYSATNGLHGFYIYHGTSTTFIGNWADHNTAGIGYYFTGGTYWAMEGCASDYNALGYELSGVAGMSLNGCGCESINASGSYDGTYYKITGSSSGVTLNGCYAYNNSAVGYWVTGSSVNVSLNNCTETEYASAGTASFKTDSGTMTSFNGYTFQTARALTSGTYNELNDGTTGEISIAGTAYLNSGLYAGGLAQLTAGSDTSGTATASTPAISTGTAVQISTAQDVMLYANIKTASTFSLAIGATSTPATTVVASGTAAIGLVSVRVPKSWYVQSTFTGADVTWTAVTC